MIVGNPTKCYHLVSWEKYWRDLGMNDQELDRVEALRTLCAEIFGRNNLIDTDFADVGAWKVEKQFMQDVSGVTIQFTISEHALGKLGRHAAMDEELTLLSSGLSSGQDDPSVGDTHD